MAEAKKSASADTPKDVKVLDCVEAKLLEIQSRLFVPKNNKNEYGNYNYRTCEDIEKQIKPLCLEYDCVLRFWDSIERIGDRIFLKANLQLFDIESKTNVMSYGWAEIASERKGFDPAQLTGSCASYARKYALAAMFLIDNEKDPDVTNKHKKDGAEVITDEKGEPVISEATGEPITTISTQQIDAINAELERTGVSESAILDFAKKNALHELTQEGYVKVIKKLNITPSKEA